MKKEVDTLYSPSSDSVALNREMMQILDGTHAYTEMPLAHLEAHLIGRSRAQRFIETKAEIGDYKEFSRNYPLLKRLYDEEALGHQDGIVTMLVKGIGKTDIDQRELKREFISFFTALVQKNDKDMTEEKALGMARDNLAFARERAK